MSAYFPRNGCPVDFPAGGLRPDPATTASIASGSANLTIVGTLSNFANGCGVAIPGAGPTSILLPPQGGVGVSLSTGNCSAIGAAYDPAITYSTGDCRYSAENVWYVSLQNANVGHTPISSPTFWKPVGFIRGGGGSAQIACVTNCGFDQTDVPANSTWGVQAKGCSDAALNSTYPWIGSLLTAQSGYQVFTFPLAGSAESATGCSFTNLFAYAVGATGSTTDHYKIVNIDDKEGYSAASSAIDITNANATQDWGNYNVIQFDARDQGVVGKPVKWSAIYKAVGAGAYSCIGAAFENAFVDHGFASYPCPPFMPATPPVAAGHQTLYTTVASGGGTANLVLTGTASATVTAGNLYHDDTWALNNCLADLSGDLGASPFTAPQYSGTAGCVIPPGSYEFEGPIVYPANAVIIVNGGINILTQPLFVTGQTWRCPAGANRDISGQDFLACPIRAGLKVPAVFVSTWGGGTNLNNFEAQTLVGYGLYVTNNLTAGKFTNLAFQQAFTGTINPALVLIGGNVLDQQFDDLPLTVVANLGNPALEFSVMPYSQNQDCCIGITNFKPTFGNVLVEGPGVAYSPTGWQGIFIHFGVSEGMMAGTAAINFDNRLAAPGAAGVGRLYLVVDAANGGVLADASVTSVVQYYDNNSTNFVSLTDNSGGAGGKSIACGPDSRLPNLPVCTDLPSASSAALNYDPLDLPLNFASAQSSTSWRLQVPLNLQINSQSQLDASVQWQQSAAQPSGLYIFATGAGSLSAGTYCMFFVGEDGKHITFPSIFATPGTTGKSNEVCQTVGASSSITVAAQSGGQTWNNNYTNIRLYYGTAGRGSENNYILVNETMPLGYVFSSTSGSIPGTYLDALKTAAVSYMYDHLTCLLCNDPANNAADPLVIGTHAWDGASKLDVLGDARIDLGHLKADKFTAPTCLANIGFLWFDVTADAWKFCNDTATPALVSSLVVYNHSGTLQALPHTVQDSCVLGSTCAVTFNGAAVFFSATSYTCSASDDSGIFAVKVDQSVGTPGVNVTFTGNGTDTIRYVCTGN